jgi:hypothetical protein
MLAEHAGRSHQNHVLVDFVFTRLPVLVDRNKSEASFNSANVNAVELQKRQVWGRRRYFFNRFVKRVRLQGVGTYRGGMIDF